LIIGERPLSTALQSFFSAPSSFAQLMSASNVIGD
jgi:hypothetical protein